MQLCWWILAQTSPLGDPHPGRKTEEAKLLGNHRLLGKDLPEIISSTRFPERTRPLWRTNPDLEDGCRGEACTRVCMTTAPGVNTSPGHCPTPCLLWLAMCWPILRTPPLTLFPKVVSSASVPPQTQQHFSSWCHSATRMVSGS